MIRQSRIAIYAGVVGAVLAGAAWAGGQHRVRRSEAVPLEASTMIIEFNASAEDVGVQFFLDSEGWREVEISDPKGKEIFSAESGGALTRQGGGTELFLESVEPPLDELTLEDFFQRFPEGTYRFRARGSGGGNQVGEAEFTHDIPAGPLLVAPVPEDDEECAMGVGIPAVIEWMPVTTDIFGDPLEVVRYEIIVENDDLNFDVKFPAELGTQVTVSPELLEPGTRYDFEVLAAEESGNQTITEGCFTTAD